MTQEEKQLLLKDLCARLPYGVKCRFETTIDTYETIEFSREGTNGLFVDFDDLYCYWFNEGFILPYLRPMSSMTDSEKEELKQYLDAEELDFSGFGYIEGGTLENYVSNVPYSICSYVIDWLNEHHFDYRGLIEMGLSLEAPKDMYKTE